MTISPDQDLPLIFQLLGGFFLSKKEMIETEGIFRICGSETKIRELELHLSQGNYKFLDQVESAHTVTNYWKRLLRNMKEPLIPFDYYHLFM